MLVVVDDGELKMLDILRTQINSDAWEIHLFQNNHTPAEDDTAADYTEATFSGYSEQTVDDFGAPSLVSGEAQVAASLNTWTHNGGAVGNDIYGYYITHSVSGDLMWAERDPNGPITIDTLNQTYNVLPRLNLRTQP